MLETDEIIGFVHQANISEEDRKRLTILTLSSDRVVGRLANLVSEVAKVHPRRRQRLKFLETQRKDLLDRLVEVGLVQFTPFLDPQYEYVDEVDFCVEELDGYVDDPHAHLDNPDCPVDDDDTYIGDPDFVDDPHSYVDESECDIADLDRTDPDNDIIS